VSKKKIKKGGITGGSGNCQQEIEDLKQRLDAAERSRDAVLKRERLIDEKLKERREQEEHLQAQIRQNEARQRELDEAFQEIQGQRSQLQDREQEIVQSQKKLLAMKAEAQTGFVEEHRKVLDELIRQVETLAEARSSLEAEIVKLAGDAAKRVEREVAEAGSARVALLERELERVRAAYEEGLRGIGEAFDSMVKGALDNARKGLDEFMSKTMEALQARLERQMKELEERERDLKVHEMEVAKREQAADLKAQEAVEAKRWAEEQIKEETERLKGELGQRIRELEEERDHLNGEVRSLMQEIEDYRRMDVVKEGRSLKEVVKELNTLRAKVDRQRQEMERMLPAEDAERLQSLERENDVYRQKIAGLETDNRRLSASVADVQTARMEKESFEQMAKVYKARVDALSKDLERLNNLWDKPGELEGRMEALARPVWDGFEFDDVSKEDEWLDRVQAGIRDAGFDFPDRLINAYHTSLKVADYAPLIVMAGPSGTGKSALGRLYSHFGGLRWHSVQVKPDWDSPQALFGHFHPIDNKFNATTLARALYQMDRDKVAAQAMLLVLMDEMNLAHVEQYFADALSLLEERRISGKDMAIELDMGAGVQKVGLILPRNVLWTGTINVDETTMTLSDKVVDRANILFFPSPERFVGAHETKLSKDVGLLRFEEWQKWVWPDVDKTVLDEFMTEYQDKTQKINKLLKETGRSLGHRVWHAMQAYMVNYPGVWDVVQGISSARADAERDENARERAEKEVQNLKPKLKRLLDQAFEDQLAQRVFPKMKGLETSGRVGDKLGEIQKAIGGYRVSGDFERAMNNPYELFMMTSADYLKDK